MSSSLFVGLKQRIDDYASIFISDKDDLDATNEDYVRAVAFRVLASAAIEGFIEERCREIAYSCVNRLKRGLPTSSGRALIVWWVCRRNPGCIPIHETDVREHFGDFDMALEAYLESVKSNHGMNSRNARNLLNPVGLRSHQIPADLLDRLQALADRRDPVVHTVAKKAIARLSPSIEKKQILDIVALLREVDDALDQALANYPLLSTIA